MQTECISTTELRVEILRHWRRPLYHLSAEINVHPATLSSMLRNRLPMPTAVKQRILLVLSGAKEVAIQRLARESENLLRARTTGRP